MKVLPRVFALLFVFAINSLAAPPPPPLQAANLKVEVDAREISRSLIHARLEIPATPGDFILWYPKWIPGIHAPGGPVQNLAGLRFETAEGEAIVWRRDDEETHRFHLAVPAGADRVIAKLDYICNQPNVNSSGVDSFGNSLLGVINWNTVLLYPETASIDTAMATVRVQLPAGWKFGTALKPTPGEEKSACVEFAPESLRRVVDCPLICGENFRTIEITGKNTPPAFLHLTSESASAIQINDALIGQYRKLVAESVALFGGARWESYHFLVVCSDTVPHNGLEHLSSSFNAVSERELIDDKKRKLWPSYLLPHEFVHSWCGKFRRPATMLTTSFHQPERTRLLWVYEGLTQYLGEVLTVRSGLLSFEENLPALAAKLDFLMQIEGRKWRSLDDTAAASWLNRAHSVSWGQLRRSQDYYNEGLLVWLEADALIRERSGGRASLDQFCKKFFSADRPKQPSVVPYDLNEIIADLKEIADEDWEKFFADRVARPNAVLGLDFLPKTLGYRLQFSAKQNDYLKEVEKSRKLVNASTSIGLSTSEEGKITSVVPGSAADKAALAGGMTISGVNGRKFSGQRLTDGIADSVSARKIELLILDGETFRTVTLNYGDGPKFLELIRTSDHPDTLAAILKPVIKDEEKK
ncbi:MAG: glycyl aminopeptidase [Chthoniobacteraceae bacterium]|nr:glycyl aminopeptidase [Chthoniobacteraceae bacterium]